MIIKKAKFASGLKLKENKLTEHFSIETIPILPSKVILPLQQHLGRSCDLLVKRGDTVKTGQLIGDLDSFVSAPVHSPVTGTIKSIYKLVNPLSNSIVDAVEITPESEDNFEYIKVNEKVEEIKNDILKFGNSDSLIENYFVKNIRNIIEKINFINNEEIISIVRRAGIVGLGGATFPTHVKLSPPKDKKIDTLIINGCECEPYITSDHRIMLEYGAQVLIGSYIIYKVLLPENVFIAIEDNKLDAMKHLDEIIRLAGLDNKFKIVSLKSRYPMGAEKILINNVLNRKVPVGGLPLDVGVVVNNVGTAKAISDALIKGIPLIERVLTVTGEVEEPKNIKVRIGTPTSEILSYCKMKKWGKDNKEAKKIIFGGPMMGNIVVNEDFPITKAVNCILVMAALPLKEGNCIRCGRCVNICPMNLTPLNYVNFVKKNRFELCNEYHILNCIECGSCAYVCPSSIPIVGYIKTGKSFLS